MLWIYPLLLRLWRKLLVKFELKTQIYWKEINREPVTFASAACSLRLLIKTGLNSRFFLRQSDGSLSSNFMLPTEFVKSFIIHTSQWHYLSYHSLILMTSNFIERIILFLSRLPWEGRLFFFFRSTSYMYREEVKHTSWPTILLKLNVIFTSVSQG